MIPPAEVGREAIEISLAPGSRIEILDGGCAPGLGASDRVRAAWRRWEERFVDHLLGDFAIVIRDPVRGVTFLARDPVGAKPLYYRVDRGVLSHGFSVAELRRRESLPLTPDPDWIARHLVGLSQDQRTTAYREIRKVAPGHIVEFGSAGEIRERRYHQWRDDAPVTTRRDDRWVADYRSVLEESIRCRMDPDHPMGTENSGGIDSATITAFLSRFLGEPGDRLHAFSFAFAEQEPALILATSRDSRVVHNHVFTGATASDPDERVARTNAILGQPEEHANASSHVPFYEECRARGIRTLFSGFGGDEVVTNIAQLVRLELLDRGDYRNLWDILPGNPFTRTLRLAKSATVGRRSPAYRPSFLRAWIQRMPFWILRPDVIERLGLRDEYMETARYDAPFRRVNDFILDHHLRVMHLTTRLENCSVMAAAYGVDYRWPLWDSRLVQQYLSTPSLEKFGPRWMGRYLHRRAIDGVVPREVAWKPTKDMGPTPVGREGPAESIRSIAAHARRHADRLHPILAELIDRDALVAQIASAESGRVDDSFRMMFRSNVSAIRRLNLWLHGGGGSGPDAGDQARRAPTDAR